MTDHFTCPACGWPQGPTHTTVWPSELAQKVPVWPQIPLAAPQGQECKHERFSFEPGDGSIQCGDCGKILNNDPNWPTDAKDAKRETPEEAFKRMFDDGALTSDNCPLFIGEGEEDGAFVPGANNSLGDGTLPSNTAPLVTTPDIAGLVERLRLLVEDETGAINRERAEAADALERMRSFLGVSEYELTAAKAEIGRLKASDDIGRKLLAGRDKQLMRLREALEKIADYKSSNYEIAPICRNIARAALTGRGE